MKKMTVILGILMATFVGCRKDEIVKPYGHGNNNQPAKFKISYTFTEGGKGVETLSGSINNGDSLHFTNGGTLILTCTDSINWGMTPGQGYYNINQIDPTLANNEAYTFIAYDGMTTVNFTIATGTAVIPTSGELMRFISKSQVGSNYNLQFRFFNQMQGGAISQYKIIGSGFNGSSWTPTAANIIFTPSSGDDSLDLILSIPNSYTGKVKVNLTRNTSWFDAHYQSSACIFYNPTLDEDGIPGPDNIFSFNFNGSIGGQIIDVNGNIVTPGGTVISGLPGTLGDTGATAKVRLDVDVLTNDYTFYLRGIPSGSTFNFKVSSTDGTLVPNGPWMTLLTTACAYSNYSQVTIIGANIENYLFFKFGTQADIEESIKFYVSSLNCCFSMTP